MVCKIEIRLIHILERDIFMLSIEWSELLQNIHDRPCGKEEWFYVLVCLLQYPSMPVPLFLCIESTYVLSPNSSFRPMDWNELNQELAAIVESATVSFNLINRGKRGCRE